MNAERIVDILDMMLNKTVFFGGIIFVLAISVGLIYRVVKKKPPKGVLPVGIMNDLPSSITGVNQYDEKDNEDAKWL